jgi:GT2 family glycosyltransferase
MTFHGRVRVSSLASQVNRVGLVAIGRNEGDRLRQCLDAAPVELRCKVYVDSGSTDQSIPLAQSKGAHVVPLDLSRPFTAARARNAGVARLLELAPDVEFVQVVDGDCELASDFIEAALAFMERNPRAAVVCGRRRERHPNASIYNQLCDIEWNTPVGEAEASGGDALIRLSAFQEVGGYDGSIIAGEEPELCLRLRARGWSIFRIDHEMTLHDAAVTRFAQWWKRAKRAGHAYAELYAMHGYWKREVRSVVVYGALLPAAAVVALPVSRAASLALVGVGYGSLYERVRRQRLRAGDDRQAAALYARFCVIAKFAHLAGMAQYAFNRARGKRSVIIEYKGPSASTASAAS